MRKLSIYYLDDDPEDLQFLTIVAESLSHTIRPFRNSADMIRELLQAPEKPDLIFIDHFLRDQTGIDIIKQIKENDTLANIPLVMISGSLDDEIIGQYDVAENIKMVQKPTDLDDYTLILESFSKID